MVAFVVIALTIILGLHIVVFRRLAVAPDWPRRIRWSIGIAIAVLLLLFFGGWRSLWAPVLSPAVARPLAWVGMSWLAFGLYLALGLLVVALVAGGLMLRGREQSKPARVRVNRIGSIAAVVVAAAVTAWGTVAASDPQVSTWEVSAADLPAEFDGTRVVVLSDMHIGAVHGEDFLRKIVDLANAEEPHLVILAGDLIEGSPDRYGDQLAPLADLDAELGVFAVTGNHEFISFEPQAWIDRWEALGITVLQNESATVERDGAQIVLAGVHDVAATDFSDDFATDPEAALEGTSPEDFILYVAHQPSQALDAQGYGIDLQVSGHTHGGQLWPMDGLVALAQPMVDGEAMVGDVRVITSRGAGTWGPPVRVGAPPEIPVITLRAG